MPIVAKDCLFVTPRRCVRPLHVYAFERRRATRCVDVDADYAPAPIYLLSVLHADAVHDTLRRMFVVAVRTRHATSRATTVDAATIYGRRHDSHGR